MDEKLELSLVQVTGITGETQRNIENAINVITSKLERKSDLIVLPEYFNTGYFPLYWDYSYMDLAEDENGATVTAFRKLAKEINTYIVVPFYEIEAPGLYYDTAVILSSEGQIVAKYRKTHPPARVSLEKIYFRAASRFPVFHLLDWKIGILICYDSYFPESARSLMLQGAELVIIPFAEVENFKMWKPLLSTRSFENAMFIGACNLVGPDKEPPKAIMGGISLIIDPEGEILAEAANNREEIITATLLRSRLLEVRKRRQWARDRRPEIYNLLSKFDEDTRGLGN